MNGRTKLEKITSKEMIIKYLLEEWCEEGIYELQRVYLWGTGELGKFALKEFRKNKREVVGFIDNDMRRVGEVIDGIPVLKPSEAEKNVTIVLCSRLYGEIRRQIKNSIGNKCVFYEVIPFLFNEFTTYYKEFECLISELIENKNKYFNLNQYYKDSLSQYIIDCIINYRLSFATKWLEKAYEKSCSADKKTYFDSEIVKLGPEEVFVDCGGYTGDTTADFIRFQNNNYKKIYIIEPDSELLEIAKNDLTKYSNIKYCNFGVGDKNEQLKFNSHGSSGSGTIDEMGESFINIVKLDDFIVDKPTYIKMDIEGAELNALKGAQQLIKNYTPKLAISVYHKLRDIYEIVEWVDSLELGYKFYLRHYSNSYDDTILYCVQ